MKKHQSPYAPLIFAATGASAEDLPKIETIMREEIFHSTLDWQTETQFTKGAIQAYRLLRANRALYEMHFSHSKAVFEEARAETRKNETAAALDRAIASGKSERVAKRRLADEKAAERLALARRKREIAARFLDRVTALPQVC
ncbi:MAG: hypothetical protein ABMA01_16935 [Chthoniobacteraceae bacterium]